MERQTNELAFLSARKGLAAVLLLAGCAGAGGSAPRGGGATVAGGKFAASSPPADSYGTDARRGCTAVAITRFVTTDTVEQAKKVQKPAPQVDARLCAVAETLLGWDEKQPQPESLLSFLAFHYGIPAAIPRVVVATIDVESERDLASRLEEPLMQYVASATGQVHYGVATTRASGGGTKIALSMQEREVEMEPFPRKLDPKAEATLSGRVLGAIQNAKVLLSDPRGKLDQPESKPGKEFRVPVSCGGNTGRMVVEIRGEEQGQVALAANFPVFCGIDPPTSVDLPSSAGDASQQERAVFDEINAERASAQIPPLQWDDKVAQVARSASDAESKAGGTGGGAGTDLAERIKAAGIASPVLLANPGARRTALDAHRRFGLSPVYRANYMSTEATHAGIGVASAKDAQGGNVAFVTELFVRELAQMDPSTVAPRLRQAINKKRSSGTFKDDPTLDKVAQEYAQALAEGNGNITDAKHSHIVSPLYKSFRTVDFLSGAKADPLEFADEKTVITSKEKSMGIGVAQGSHPVLGKNATYVVLLFGTRK